MTSSDATLRKRDGETLAIGVDVLDAQAVPDANGQVTLRIDEVRGKLN